MSPRAWTLPKIPPKQLAREGYMKKQKEQSRRRGSFKGTNTGKLRQLKVEILFTEVLFNTIFLQEQHPLTKKKAQF